MARANRKDIEALNTFDPTLPTHRAQQLVRRFRLTSATAETIAALAWGIAR